MKVNMDRRVTLAVTLMQQRYTTALTLEEIAGEVHLTREHFSRLFKAEIGIPPAKYIKRLRLQKGRELLETTLLSVKEIMHKVGVSDESHFVRDFKLAYGLSPMQYRLQHIPSKVRDIRYDAF
jgi:AraC family transcriptional regulator